MKALQLSQLLGFIMENGQVKVEKRRLGQKINTMAEWPRPENRKHLFICDYSKVAAPLTQLTFTKIPFPWTTEVEPAFTELHNHHHFHPRKWTPLLI